MIFIYILILLCMAVIFIATYSTYYDYKETDKDNRFSYMGIVFSISAIIIIALYKYWVF